MRTQKILGFTLVELIVVITIVGILSTVGFVSYSGYLGGARDSNRMSQLTKISDSLQVYAATKSLPLPDNYVEIQASGSTIAYQGEVGVDVLETIDYTNGGTDPKDDSYYTYYLTKDRKSIQLMALMEEQSTVAYNTYSPLLGGEGLGVRSVLAADYTERYPKVYGRKLGVLTQVDTNTPIQQLPAYSSTPFDIVTETSSFIAHISDSEKLEGTGSTLQASVSNGSCKRIKQTGGSRGSDTYTINPGGTGDITVYCDMETAGGGWTLIGRSATGSTGSIGWGVTAGGVSNDNTHYSLGSVTESMNFESIMVGRYSSDKNIDYAITFSASSKDYLSVASSTTPITNCKLEYGGGLTSTEKLWNHCGFMLHWGNTGATNKFFFANNTGSASYGLMVNDFSAAAFNSAYGAWHLKQGMMFVK